MPEGLLLRSPRKASQLSDPRGKLHAWHVNVRMEFIPYVRELTTFC
jgi:hypothetical protein